MGSTLGGLLEEDAVTRRDVGRFAHAVDVATDSRLRVVRVVIVTAIASSRNKRESSLKAAITARRRGLAEAGDRAVGHVGARVRVGAVAPGVLALVGADAGGMLDVHAELDLADVVLTVLTEV